MADTAGTSVKGKGKSERVLTAWQVLVPRGLFV